MSGVVEQALVADHISLAYSKQTLTVQDVSLSVGGGRDTSAALIGESGSGKSTIARALLGLLRPVEGRVEFAGRELHQLSRSEYRRYRNTVQPVLQQTSALNPRMHIRSILAEAVRASGDKSADATSPDRIAALLQAVDLDPPLATRHPHQLSGGQRQRVVIARALAVNASILVLDEPTSALDVTVQARILELLKSLRKDRDINYLLITHNLAIVEHLCGTTHVLFGGRIVETGPTSAILQAPEHPYTRLLRQSVPELGVQSALPQRLSGAELPSADGCPFRLRCPNATQLCAEQMPTLEERRGRLVACHHLESAPDVIAVPRNTQWGQAQTSPVADTGPGEKPST